MFLSGRAPFYDVQDFANLRRMQHLSRTCCGAQCALFRCVSISWINVGESLTNVFKILSNLGHIFRVCSVFYGKHCQRHNRLKYRVVLLKKLLKVVPQALNQNLALTSSILKYMCRAERPFLFQQIQMIQKYLNHFSLQSVSQSLVFEEKEKFDKKLCLAR